MGVVVQRLAVVREVREHRPANPPSEVRACGVHRPAMPEDHVAFPAGDLQRRHVPNHLPHRVSEVRPRRPVGGQSMSAEHDAMAPRIDGEPAAAWRHGIQIRADVELLAHLVGVRPERFGDEFLLGHPLRLRFATRKERIDAASSGTGAQVAEQRSRDLAHGGIVRHQIDQKVGAAQIVQLDGRTVIGDALPTTMRPRLRHRRHRSPLRVQPRRSVLAAQPPAGIQRHGHPIQEVVPDAIHRSIDGIRAEQPRLHQKAVLDEEIHLRGRQDHAGRAQFRRLEDRARPAVDFFGHLRVPPRSEARRRPLASRCRHPPH